MSYNWEQHLEEVEKLGSYETEQYFNRTEELILRRFDEEYETLQQTDPDDISPQDMLSIDPNEAEYLLEEIEMSEKADTYATVYREMHAILDRNRGLTQRFTEEIKEYKQERDSKERNIDRYSQIEVPENIVVEVIEEELNPVLQQIS